MDSQVAYIRYLVEIKLKRLNIPDNIKEQIKDDFTIYLTQAGLTNIKREQITEFLLGYEDVFNKLMSRLSFKYKAELIYTRSILREILMLQLNKSIDGWQGTSILRKDVKYTVSQRLSRLGERARRFFSRKKEEEELEEAM